MLGTSANLAKYRTLDDFKTPVDYLNFMFSSVDGLVYRATIDPKYNQTFYRAGSLRCGHWNGIDNCYVSMNTFYRIKGLKQQEGRLVSLLKRLNAFYVDLDCYKLGLKKNEILERLEEDYFGSRIPEPTFIIDSGRGIYLIWKLRNEDKRALPRWTTVQQYLVETLEELGADPACTDAARILRVPFTHNPKSGTDVSIVEFNDLTYSIYDIAKEYEIKSKISRKKAASESSVAKYPYGHATERQRKYVRDIADVLDLDEKAYPDFTSFQDTDSWIKLHKDAAAEARKARRKGYSYTVGNVINLPEFRSIKSLLGSYCAELRKLFAVRKGENCKRELALFLYRYWLREMKYDSATALKETLAFNASLDCPFDEEYVIRVTASADTRVEKGLPYAYKKSTLIRILDITADELQQLPVLGADVQNRRARRQERDRAAYAAKLQAQGAVTKKDAVLQRRAAIYSLQIQGKTAAEIQELLEISKSTYYRDCESLKIAEIKASILALLKQSFPKRIKKAAKKAAENAKKDAFSVAIRAADKCIPKFSVTYLWENAFGVPRRAVDVLSVMNMEGGASTAPIAVSVRELVLRFFVQLSCLQKQAPALVDDAREIFRSWLSPFGVADLFFDASDQRWRIKWEG